MRDDADTGFSFHVDHIISKKHDGTNDYINLAWSCFQYNVFKGTDIASYDLETGLLVPFFNPRTEKWDGHFIKDDLYIRGITPVGRATVHILQLNHDDQLDIRSDLRNLGLW